VIEVIHVDSVVSIDINGAHLFGDVFQDTVNFDLHTLQSCIADIDKMVSGFIDLCNSLNYWHNNMCVRLVDGSVVVDVKGIVDAFHLFDFGLGDFTVMVEVHFSEYHLAYFKKVFVVMGLVIRAMIDGAVHDSRGLIFVDAIAVGIKLMGMSDDCILSCLFDLEVVHCVPCLCLGNRAIAISVNSFEGGVEKLVLLEHPVSVSVTTSELCDNLIGFLSFDAK